MVLRGLRLFVTFLKLWACAFLIVSQATKAHCSPSVVYLDSPKGPFLQNVPAGSGGNGVVLSAKDLVVVGTSLLGLAPPFAVDADQSKRIGSLITPDVFNRPQAVLALNIAGIDALDPLVANVTSSFSEEGRAALGPIVGLTEGDPGAVFAVVQLIANVAKGRSGSVRVLGTVARPDCSDACLDLGLKDAVGEIGGRYEPRAEPLTGTLSFGSASYSLSDAHLHAWGREIAGLWGAVERIMSESEVGKICSRPALLESTLMGLQFARVQQGADYEFSGLVTLTGAILRKVHAKLFDALDGRLVLQIGLLGDASTSSTKGGLTVEELAQVAVTHHRQLLQASNANVQEGSGDEALAVSKFSTKAAGYSIFLLFLFAMLGTMYCMLHMPVQKDTLLYSRLKSD